MKVLVQRVSQASVEVDGLVESRIGVGAVVLVAFHDGDSLKAVDSLAAKVIKLKLWPEVTEAEGHWSTTVADTGNEVLVLLQQTLTAEFHADTPDMKAAMPDDEASHLFNVFLKKLRTEYQEEMVVGSIIHSQSRVEIHSDGFAFFQLSVGDEPGRSRQGPPGRGPEETSIASLTKMLHTIPTVPRGQATSEAGRVFRIVSLARVRAAISAASPAQSRDFAAAFSAAGRFFSPQQQEQILALTGYSCGADDEDDEAEPYTPPGDDEDGGAGVLRGQQADTRPDMRGRAAPETPATHPWLQPSARNHGKGYKGKGKGKPGKVYRSAGIASLADSAQIHGNSSAGYQFAQHARYSEHELHFMKTTKDEPWEGEDGDGGEDGGATKKRRLVTEPPRRPKGTPTVAPMCPPTDGAGEDV